MAKAKRKLDPALEALVRERLEGDEMVLAWIELHPGEVTIRLIREELHRVCAPLAKKFGRGAGCGRSLTFKLQDGQWVFQGIGGWIAYQFLTPRFEQWGQPLHLAPWIWPVAAGVAGALVGWMLAGLLNRLLGWSFRLFNQGFDWTTLWYTQVVGKMLRISALVLVVYGCLLYLTYWGFTRTPTGFIPAQDHGNLIASIQAPPGSQLQRTSESVLQVMKIALDTPGVEAGSTYVGVDATTGTTS